VAGSGENDQLDRGRLQRPGLTRRDFLRRSIGTAIALPGAAAIIAAIEEQPAHAATVPRSWYKTDTHVHSVWSSDAFNDFGIITSSAKTNGYDALIMSDHDSASSFPVSGQTANKFVMEDSLARWTARNTGSLSASTNALVSSPVNSGSKSLEMSATSSTSGEVSQWGRRGPSLRAGNTSLRFSIRPTRLDPGCGFYVSVAIGGDPSIATPDGYTTSAGVVSPGKSIVFVWQVGSLRTPSTDPNARVFVSNLAPAPLNVWTPYVIDVTAALASIPSSEMPLDYNGFLYPKMAVVAAAGTVDVFVDSYQLSTSTPISAAQEFVYRTSIVNAFDTSTFLSFPALEMGVTDHAQRFEFGITQTSDFVSYASGLAGIPLAQGRGYPAQLNHPGAAGGLSTSQTISTKAADAEMIEVRDPAWKSLWDQILNQGVPLIGTWSTDAHNVLKKGNPATYLYATGLTFDAFMRELFEGRCYCATNNFAGRIIFNVDGSADPHPARYPIYVPDAQTSAIVRLQVTAGLSSGASIGWISDNAQVGTSSVSSTTFAGSRTVALSGTFTYIRAEVVSSSGSLKGLSQAIFYFATTGLPNGWSYRVRNIDTSNGRNYTKLVTKGIASSSWDGAGKKLAITLSDPVGAVVELEVVNDAGLPGQVLVDGTSAPAAASQTDFDASASTTWFADLGGVLRVKVRHVTTSAAVVVDWGTSTPDTTGPTVPQNVTATPVSSTRVDLTWTASLDNVGVSRYNIVRNGTFLTSVAGDVTACSDTSVVASTAYSYTVEAFDAAGNHAGPSAAAQVTTPGGGTLTTATFTPIADAYVNEVTPTTNYNGTSLRVDGSPVLRSFLKFDLRSLVGTVTKATMRVYPTSSQTTGHDVRSVSDTSWSETGITHGTAPATGSVVGSSGRITAGAWTEVDVTSLVTGPSLVALALTTTGLTAVAYSSREAATNKPQLVVETLA
jgi:hypothetical protein